MRFMKGFKMVSKKQKALAFLETIKDVESNHERWRLLMWNTGYSAKFCQECVKEFSERERNAKTEHEEDERPG